MTGTLLPEGWGAAAGYPGIVLDEHGAEVAGFLFSSDALPDTGRASTRSRARATSAC